MKEKKAASTNTCSIRQPSLVLYNVRPKEPAAQTGRMIGFVHNIIILAPAKSTHSFCSIRSISKIQEMALFGLLSPSQTQSPSLLSPVEELRNWLASRGLDAEEVDTLRRYHNQCLQNIENEQYFLTHLQEIVKTSLRQQNHLPEYSSPTKNELDQVKASLASLTSEANTQLREQSNAAGKKICIDALLLLPVEKRVAFLSFINNDTANDRLRFINDVLPFLVSSLSTKVAEESEVKDEKEPSPPPPVSGRSRKQRRRTAGEMESYRVTKIPRRSERIKGRADDRQDQLPGDWKKRKRSSKGRANG